MDNTSVRAMYESHGVQNYYVNFADKYFNPHEEQIQALIKQLKLNGKILDLSCGHGSASLAITHCKVIGCDPYLHREYEERTGNSCLQYSFDDIINGALDDMKFDSIVCSFALHLCEESKLNTLLYQLARVSDELIIVSPHKRPEVEGSFWVQTYANELNRVKIKRFKSKLTKQL